MSGGEDGRNDCRAARRQCKEEAKALKPGSGFEWGQFKISPNHRVETEEDDHPTGLIDRKLHGARSRSRKLKKSEKPELGPVVPDWRDNRGRSPFVRQSTKQKVSQCAGTEPQWNAA